MALPVKQIFIRLLKHFIHLGCVEQNNLKPPSILIKQGKEILKVCVSSITAVFNYMQRNRFAAGYLIFRLYCNRLIAFDVFFYGSEMHLICLIIINFRSNFS